MKVKKIEPAGYADVYNMEVEGTHDFAVGSGVIVHNCYDEWRYVCMSRPIAPRIKTDIDKEWTPPIEDPLNLISDDGYTDSFDMLLNY